MEKSYVFTWFGIEFSANVLLASFSSVVIIFLICFLLSRRIELIPKRAQAALEMLVEFTNGIVGNTMDDEHGKEYRLFTFTLFLYIAVCNIIGLSMIIVHDEYSFWGSPTASAIVCLGLSAMVILLSHYKASEKLGTKTYIRVAYFEPVKFMFPIKLIEEFTNTLTLGLRLYGNIYAGEILLTLLAMLATSHGLFSGVLTVPLTMIWIAFSIFIGMIQAFVFATLSNVYISHKIVLEH
ncbi:F0F1 ATP synthase subunit A [Atopobacter phocae]|uniref:F0F1 ATP synthase subunit A n=1 Tax=Atopobacter phocae TaxID=136492 RepID=UPI0004716EE3|nr:F0F1 ATP synthase subunit A [Atopobacter phocae]